MEFHMIKTIISLNIFGEFQYSNKARKKVVLLQKSLQKGTFLTWSILKWFWKYVYNFVRA